MLEFLMISHENTEYLLNGWDQSDAMDHRDVELLCFLQNLYRWNKVNLDKANKVIWKKVQQIVLRPSNHLSKAHFNAQKKIRNTFLDQ